MQIFLVTQLFKKIIPTIANFIHTIPRKICYFLELQLFITILAFPIFLSWGLPISLLSPLGNLIFTPWLTIFLTLSSLIFFLEIVGIQNYIIIYLLEKLNQLFFYVLDLADKSYMVSCACPNSMFLVLIPISLFFLIKHRKSSNIYLRVLKLFIFSSLLFFSLKYVLAPRNLFEYIINKDKNVLLIKHSAKNALLDLGALSEGHSAQMWVKYQLLPKLLKLGIDQLDCIIIPKPSSKLFESLIELSKNIPIKQVYLQEWKGLIPCTGWKCWKAVLDLKKKKHIKVTLLKESLKIRLEKNFVITINQIEKFITKGPLKYKQLKIEAKLTDKALSILEE